MWDGRQLEGDTSIASSHVLNVGAKVGGLATLGDAFAAALESGAVIHHKFDASSRDAEPIVRASRLLEGIPQPGVASLRFSETTSSVFYNHANSPPPLRRSLVVAHSCGLLRGVDPRVPRDVWNVSLPVTNGLLTAMVRPSHNAGAFGGGGAAAARALMAQALGQDQTYVVAASSFGAFVLFDLRFFLNVATFSLPRPAAVLALETWHKPQKTGMRPLLFAATAGNEVAVFDIDRGAAVCRLCVEKERGLEGESAAAMTAGGGGIGAVGGVSDSGPYGLAEVERLLLVDDTVRAMAVLEGGCVLTAGTDRLTTNVRLC